MAESGLDGPNRYQFDDLTVDTGKRLVLRDTSALEISGLTYDLLLAIIQAAPNIISHDDLVDKVWSGRPTSPETITQRAMMLRQALDDTADHPRYFEVVRGHGFRLIPEATSGAVRSSTAAQPTNKTVTIIAVVVAILVSVWAIRNNQQANLEVIGASIAVLPFVNMSAEPENEFFSDGIAEEILNVLARIPDLKVAARTSAFSYKGTKTNISRIAEELGVTHILEGSVRKSGNQVRVTAQLIKADDGFHMWSQNYDRELIDIFAIQDEIAESIASALKVSLRLASRPAGNLTGTNSIEAYEHYLQGISFWHERTLISLESASKEFEAAATLDPQFAKAWAGQALFWAVFNTYTHKTVAGAHDRARTAAMRALSLDPESVESMAVLGLVTKNSSVAFEYFDRAIELNPSSANTYHWYSVRLTGLGDSEASLAMARKAWTLDPRAPNNSLVLALRLSDLGYYREAEQITQELLRYAPEHLFGLRMMLVLKILSGECASARQYGDKLAELLNKEVNSTQVYMDLCQQDNPAVRAAAVKTVLTWPYSVFYDPAEPNLSTGADMITLLTELGELDAAWQLLEKHNTLAAIRTRTTENGISLRCDPRVQKLAERLGRLDPIKPVSCD